MEAEYFFKCDRCRIDSVHSKVWIRSNIYYLCKSCFIAVEEIDNDEDVTLKEMGL